MGLTQDWGGKIARLSTDANGNAVLVGEGGIPIESEIALYVLDEYIAGVPQESGLPIPSSVLSSTSLGTPLTWVASLFDSTVGVWSAANPERITIPAGITKAWFTGSVFFPPNATGARWLRLLKNGTTHTSNVLLPTAHAVLAQPVTISTGWIDVATGDYYHLAAVQDSGSTLTPSLGSLANKGGSSYFRAAFKK